MIKKALFFATILFAGVAIGYFLRPNAPAPDDPKKSTVRIAAPKIADMGNAASMAALRTRVRELEALVAELSSDEASTARVEVAEADEPPKGPSMIGAGSLREIRERMAKLKEENPDEYERMVTGMKRWRQHRMNRAHEKVEFLSSIDTSQMTEAQKNRHEHFQELLAKREDLESKMYDDNLSEEEREKARQDAVNTDHEMRWVGRQERDALLDQTAQALGFQEEDTRAVRDTLRQVVSTTDTSFMPPAPQK